MRKSKLKDQNDRAVEEYGTCCVNGSLLTISVPSDAINTNIYLLAQNEKLYEYSISHSQVLLAVGMGEEKVNKQDLFCLPKKRHSQESVRFHVRRVRTIMRKVIIDLKYAPIKPMYAKSFKKNESQMNDNLQ